MTAPTHLPSKPSAGVSIFFGDTGSACSEAVYQFTELLIADGKCVLIFDTRGAHLSVLRFSASTFRQRPGKPYFINSFVGEDFHMTYARPDWSEAIKSNAVVCTSFPDLGRIPPSETQKCMKVLNDAISAIKELDDKRGLIFVIDDLSLIASEIQAELNALSKEGVRVIVGCDYGGIFRAQESFDLDRSVTYFLKADESRDLSMCSIVPQGVSSLACGNALKKTPGITAAESTILRFTPLSLLNSARFANPALT